MLRKVIPARSLANLKEYKYSSVDKSLVSKYVLRHYWEWLVGFFPYWMAPNTITALGFSFILVQLGLLFAYSPELADPCPPWFYWLAAATLWIYASFDAVDGKQARRTKQSGPLGELFDHCCDAMNTVFGSFISASALNVAGTPTLWVIMGTAMANFYFSTWEEYHTGTLYLGYFSGPVEGIFLLIGTFVLAGIYGPGYFDAPLNSVLPHAAHSLLPRAVSQLPLGQATAYGGALSMGVCIVLAITNVYAHKGPTRSRSPHSFPRALSSALPFAALLAGATAMVHFAPAVQAGSPARVAFHVAVGFIFAALVARVIVAHVSHQPFPGSDAAQSMLQRARSLGISYGLFWAVALLSAYSRNSSPLLAATKEQHWSPSRLLDLFNPPVAAVAGGKGMSVGNAEQIAVFALCAFSVVEYVAYAARVISEICAELDIWCFTIKHPAVDSKGKDLRLKSK